MIDPVLMKAENIIHAGESYRVEAIESNPTILELRQAGEDYPDWVKRNYLQLPENLSGEVSTLAARLVSEKETVFDKATAVTNYLRREITYSKVVSRPPFGVDLLAWFLFDYKLGYCNYSATAEVILLRAAGIPARLVVGFAQGQKVQGQKDVYTVKQSDAHAWPEVFFPGIGWVEFEPTTSQEIIRRPSGIDTVRIGNPTPGPLAKPDLEDEIPTPRATNPAPVPEVDINPPIANETQGGAPVFIYVLFGLLIIGLSGFLFWRGQQRQRSIPTPLPVRMKLILEKNSIHVPDWLQNWVMLVTEEPIEKYFRTVYTCLRWLGKAANPSDTPMEASLKLQEWLPEASPQIDQLRDEYQKFLFSQQPENILLAQSASLQIRKQTRRAMFYNWRNQFFARS